LDLFRATNLGRLLQGGGADAKDPVRKSTEKKRQSWGMSPGANRNVDSSKQKMAHVLVKNPFPEQIIQQAKSSISSIASQKKQINFENDDIDAIDKFLSQAMPVAEAKKTDPIAKQEKVAVADQRQVTFSKIEEKPSTFEDKLQLFSKDFLIPTLPKGTKLEFNILTTWGDVNYVGLTGIEIFDASGKPVKIEDSQISACPPDINILPGYGGDPRTIEKLIDGHYLTNDDMHVWLTPFTAGEDHTITIDLKQSTTIAMIRIWNYNKSRIHSYRGARLINCELDGKAIFRGEI